MPPQCFHPSDDDSESASCDTILSCIWHDGMCLPCRCIKTCVENCCSCCYESITACCEWLWHCFMWPTDRLIWCVCCCPMTKETHKPEYCSVPNCHWIHNDNTEMWYVMKVWNFCCFPVDRVIWCCCCCPVQKETKEPIYCCFWKSRPAPTPAMSSVGSDSYQVPLINPTSATMEPLLPAYAGAN